MNSIKEQYQALRNEPFPDGIAGKEVRGIDLVLLDAETAGFIEKFIHYNFKLTSTDFDLLIKLSENLKTVTKDLDGKSLTYFSTLLNLANRVITDTSVNRLNEN